MKVLVLLVFVLNAFQISESVQGTRFRKFRRLVEHHRRQRVDKVIAERYRKNGYKSSPTQTFFLEQPLDHFNAMSKELGKTYKQRYYVNDEFWSGQGSPVFLYIGGEIYELGSQHKALLLGVEHRFYGASLNDDGLQLEELQYLSSQQALADLATFVRYIRNKHGIPDSTPWICFGGSYPGSLAAWFRLKYPHLVAGAVASSAPVRAITNFEGYNDVVAASLASELVGGSKACLETVRAAFRQIDDMILYTQFDQLQEDFQSCNKISMKEDLVQFVSNLAEYIKGVVQDNSAISKKNISHVCDVMTSTSNPYTNLVALNKDFMAMDNETCVDNSYMNYMAMISNTTVDRADTEGWVRQWMFQTCSQFGYYVSGLQGLDICQKVFKINPEHVDVNVQFTNDYYGGNQTQQSNIVFVNGSIDPWHWLSILTNQTALHEYAVFIPGVSHIADLGEASDSDPAALTEARQVIAGLVAQFLEDAVRRKS